VFPIILLIVLASEFVLGLVDILHAYISKKHFRPGRLAASEWTRSVKAVRDTPVAVYSAPASIPRIALHIALRSPFLLALSVSYFKQTLWHCGQL